MDNIDIDVKKELKGLKDKVRKFDKLVDYNSISYSDFLPFVLNVIQKFDKRLDDIESRLNAKNI